MYYDGIIRRAWLLTKRWWRLLVLLGDDWPVLLLTWCHYWWYSDCCYLMIIHCIEMLLLLVVICCCWYYCDWLFHWWWWWKFWLKLESVRWPLLLVFGDTGTIDDDDDLMTVVDRPIGCYWWRMMRCVMTDVMIVDDDNFGDGRYSCLLLPLLIDYCSDGIIVRIILRWYSMWWPIVDNYFDDIVVVLWYCSVIIYWKLFIDVMIWLMEGIDRRYMLGIDCWYVNFIDHCRWLLMTWWWYWLKAVIDDTLMMIHYRLMTLVLNYDYWYWCYTMIWWRWWWPWRYCYRYCC